MLCQWGPRRLLWRAYSNEMPYHFANSNDTRGIRQRKESRLQVRQSEKRNFLISEQPAAESPLPPESDITETNNLPKRLWIARGRDIIAISAILAIVTAVCFVRLWLRPGLGDWDIMTFYLPWYSFLGEQLRQGNIPAWNPHIFSGTPFAGDPQSGWWYFPAMLLFTILPPIFAYKAFIWLHLVACGIGVYILARMLKLGPLGAFAGGLMFACLNLGASFTFMIQMQMAPWLPISLIGVELAARRTGRISQLRALTLTGFAVSQVFAANIGQGTYYTGLLVGAYIVVRFVFFPEKGPVPAWRAGVITSAIAGFWTFGLAFLLGAAGFLPRLDATRRAFVSSEQYPGRHPSSDVGADPLYIAYRLLDLFPEKFDLYAGGSAITIALISFVLLSRYRQFIFFAAVAVISIVLSLKPTRLHELFYLLPEFRELHGHEPARILSLLPFALAMLGALAVDKLRMFSRANWAIGGLVIAGLVWLRIAESARKPATYLVLTNTTKISAILIGASIAAVLVLNMSRIRSLWRERFHYVAAGVILVALFIDPVGAMLAKPVHGYSDEGILSSAVSTSGSGTDTGGAGEFLQSLQDDSEPFRYFGFAAPPNQDNWQFHEVFSDPWIVPLLGNNRAMMLGLYDIQGYDPAQIVRYLNTFTAMNGFQREYHEALVYEPALGSPILDLLNVRYIIVPKTTAPFGNTPPAKYPAQYQPVFENDEVTVLENANALPHAWIVHDVTQIPATDALQQINEGTIDASQTATFESTPPTVAPLSPGASESATVMKYDPDEIVVSTSLASDGVLVLSDTYDPDWNVEIDGKSAEVFPVDGVLQGVAVESGQHTVTFSYKPTSLQAGFIISVLVFGALCAFFVYTMLRDRRRRHPQVETRG